MSAFRKFAEFMAFGFFAAIALFIIYVQAGAYGGRSGGQQTADILNGFGSAGANLAASLEGRSTGGAVAG